MAAVQCVQCGATFNVVPARLSTAKFCSLSCRGKAQAVSQRGKNNPKWLGGAREKVCQHCGVRFTLKPKQPITTFRNQKFCSKACADKGGFRRTGEQHPLYKPDSRRNNRRGKHGAWSRSVISRDRATCQQCGATGIELHAHHIKPFRDFPELRWELSNGITLCHKCHWAVHAASNANGVNSGNILPGKAGDNPEPSNWRKPVEGVTTRGRAYRRWMGHCAYCGEFISKRWSDTVGKSNLFCSKSCSSKFTQRQRR